MSFDGGVGDNERSVFAKLFQEFAQVYPDSEVGRQHAALYGESRAVARENLERIMAASERGEDVAELVLLNLLPYSETVRTREGGYWISVAPVFTIQQSMPRRRWRQMRCWLRCHCCRTDHEIP